jgi:hypothetical protein
MRPSLSSVIHDLEKQIDGSQNLIARTKDLGLPRIQVEIVAELAFLRIFIAWENFLEDSFIRYLVGAVSPSGYSPQRFVNPPNMKIAIRLISAEKEYIKWNSASDVIARSEIYFGHGAPYKNVLQSATTDLNNMNTIRNRIAHKSIVSQNKFNDFVRRELGYGRRGMTPGRLLLSPKNSSSKTTFLEHYVEIIKTASRMIVG